MPAYGTVMLPSESTIWSGSVTKLPGRAPASLGRKSPPASASKIVTLTTSPMPRVILLGGRRENNASALSSCIRFCRSMVPPAALLHRTRVRNWREESESHCGGKDDIGLPDQHWILICRSPPLRGLDELRERSHGAASIRGRSITLSNQHSHCTIAARDQCCIL